MGVPAQSRSILTMQGCEKEFANVAITANCPRADRRPVRLAAHGHRRDRARRPRLPPPGAWAFLAPRSFYDNVATFEPYNLHLLHDLGAFQLAIGASLLAALLWSDGLTVALAGATVGAVVHDVAHFMDRDLGGRSSDPWTLGLLAVLLLVALALRIRARRRA